VVLVLVWALMAGLLVLAVRRAGRRLAGFHMELASGAPAERRFSDAIADGDFERAEAELRIAFRSTESGPGRLDHGGQMDQ
jgi:hypothetical protein